MPSRKVSADRVDVGEKQQEQQAGSGPKELLRGTEKNTNVSAQEAMELFNKLNTFYKTLAAPFESKEEDCKVLLLGLMTKQNVIYIGKPGLAKSAIVMRAAQLMGGESFKIQLQKGTQIEELLGFLDYKALVDEKKFQRTTKGMLPEADVAIFDEVFEGNSMVLNAMRSLLEERKVNDGHGNMVGTKLRSVIGTTNIIPDEEEKGLHGVYDRFLLRQFSQAVPKERRENLLEAAHNIEFGDKGKAITPVISQGDLDRIYEMVGKVDVKIVSGELTRLWNLFEKDGMEFSDRRVGKAQLVIAASAVLNGRTTATFSDLLVLKYVLPKDEDQMRRVEALLNKEVLTPEKCKTFLDSLEKNISKANDVMAGRDKLHGKTSIDVEELESAKEKLLRIGKGSGDDSIERRAEGMVKDLDRAIDKSKKWNEEEEVRQEKAAAEAARLRAKKRDEYEAAGGRPRGAQRNNRRRARYSQTAMMEAMMAHLRHDH